MIGIQKIQKIRKMLNPDKNPDPEFREKIFFQIFIFQLWTIFVKYIFF